MAMMLNPMMGNMGMMSMGGMSSMFMMMQMMQMMQMMMSMMGNMGGQGGHHCGCHQHMGQTMGMPGQFPMNFPMMPFPMQTPPFFPPMSHAPPISQGALQNATPTGRALAHSIMNRPVPPNCRPGYCYRGVKHHLRNVGVNLHGGSAYMAADQLSRYKNKFEEVSVSRAQLKKLPPGAVVVWNRSPGKPHGHISIATGDGREASDKIRNQMTRRNASYRVFIPK